VELRDRCIVITGAGSGIGRAMAERFAAEAPRRLILADLDLESAEHVAAGIGPVALAVRTDVGVESEIQQLVAQATEAGGPIDLFCSNAGIGGPGAGPEAPDDAWEQIWRINVMAHIWAARALVPTMAERGEGYLLSTASAAGLLTQVGAMPYSVTKHAAVAAAEWLSIMYADAGLKVSCLCPLGVRTPMLEDALEEEGPGATALLQDDLMEPADVAEAVVDGLREERFLILPHENVARYLALKGAQPERWLAGMRKLVRSAR
jgi:NAD(P)-dependent dehydrogenase (short-subunit alcohol dehydrogenase family)